MKLEISHIAIATPQVTEVLNKLKTLGLQVEKTTEVPTEKVRATMIPVAASTHFRIELLEPTHPDSPLSKFLEKRPGGGIHHLSFEVEDLSQWVKVLENSGMQILPPGIRVAARGRAIFIHPKSFSGILVELEELN